MEYPDNGVVGWLVIKEGLVPATIEARTIQWQPDSGRGAIQRAAVGFSPWPDGELKFAAAR